MATPKLIVEAAHIYTNEAPNGEHLWSARLGTKIARLYEQICGISTEKWLFIDDYNPKFQEKPIVLNEAEYVRKLAEANFQPDKVVHEADLVETTLNLIKYLQGEDLAYEHQKTGNILLRKKGILLYEATEERCSCPALDAALHQRKIEEGAYSVTVVPASYTSQQKKTKTILKKLGCDTKNMHSIFFTRDMGDMNRPHFNVVPSFTLVELIAVALTEAGNGVKNAI